MRVLGIDPGSRHCGYAFVDSLSGSRMATVAHGTLSPSATLPLEQRLAAIFSGLEELIRRHQPESCAVEEIFFAANARSALVLGHARGVALLGAARAGLKVHAYTPSVIKHAVVGTGRADKQQVARMVGVILGLKDTGRADTSDALAIALTHAMRGAPLAPAGSRR